MLTKYSARRLSRLASIQAAYQKMQTDDEIEDVIQHFQNYHFIDGVLKSQVQADSELFKSITYGVQEKYTEIMQKISQHLNENWRIERLSFICLAILLCAVYEILYEQTPKNIAINEYLELSKDFLNSQETKFVNGILDRVSKTAL
jgi:N utilization substance protein B